MKKVQAIKKDKKGNIISINLSSTEANDDWKRAARLAKSDPEELEKLMKKSMYVEEKKPGKK